MAIEFYWGSGSGPSWRAMLALVVKGVAFESRLVSFSKREHKTPEFLRLNPRGKVPVLRDGDFVLNESLAIMAYLDEKVPEPPLFGRTPEARGQIWRLVLEGENHLNIAVREVVTPILFSSIEGKEETIRTAAVALQPELALWNERIRPSGWLHGDALTAADLSIFTIVKFLIRGLTRPKAAPLGLTLLPLEAQYPKLMAMVARIEALPGYDATYPPHWREG